MLNFIIPSSFVKSFAVYHLIDATTNQRVFVWQCKTVELLNLSRPMSNPAFDATKQYHLQVLSWHDNYVDAQNAFAAVIQREGMPALNKTIRWNRYGLIKCNETGVIYRNASDAAKMLGINQSRLSQHLQNVPGAKTLKGMTFSYAAPTMADGKIAPGSPVKPTSHNFSKQP